MGNADTKLNFRKAIVQLANKSQVSSIEAKTLVDFQSCIQINKFFKVDSSQEKKGLH